jgi:hypothetical protein
LYLRANENQKVGLTARRQAQPLGCASQRIVEDATHPSQLILPIIER